MTVSAAARRRRYAARSLAASALAVLLASSCSPSAAGGASTAHPPAAPQGDLTPAVARQVFSTFVTADDVARAAGDEPLQVSLVNEAQLPLTVSAYERRGYFGTPVARYRYGQPRLYVPALTGFPLWFAAVVARAPIQGGPARTAIMVFNRETPSDRWQLSLSTLLQPGMTLPRIALDRNGYAKALATFDHGLLVSPNSAGALQAAVADDGAASAAAALVASGPYTTGLYAQSTAAKHAELQRGLHYDSMIGGTAFPLYALATADLGGLVLYSLTRSDAFTWRAERSGPIQVPPAFEPILYATGRLVIQSELDTGVTFQFAAYVPPRGARGAMMRVLASDGGPTSAGGT